MRIGITGTPGTGKTITAKLLAKELKCELIDLKKVVKKRGLLEGIEVDTKKLQKELSSILKTKKNFVIEGHLLCEMKTNLDILFVLRTTPKELRKRLKKRKYSGKKIEENIMAELLDYCSIKSSKKYKKIIELDTGIRSIKKTIKKMLKALGDKKQIDKIDYTQELIDYLNLKKSQT